MESIWLQLLTFALPSGFIGSFATWLVTRRQRRNDFLAEMQKSIDLLSEKYNAVLQDNITLRQEKAEWKVSQRELLLKVDKLTREVESLRKHMNKHQKENDTNNPGKSPRAAARRAADDDGLRGHAVADVADLRAGGGDADKPKKRKRALRQSRSTASSSGREPDGSEPDAVDGGGGSAGTDGTPDDSDAEPP